MYPILRTIPLLLLAAGPLHAQEPARRDTVDRLDTAVVRLPDVTVTATRAPARILDVPLAVTVVGREELQDAQGNRVDQALRTVPGVLAQSRTGGSDLRIVIRGFGARGAGDRSNAGTTRGIRILQDGVPETEPDGRTAMDLIDLGAVQEMEVVRSNASALWGNAAGGVVSFSSVPAFDVPFVQAEQQAGGFGLMRYVARGGRPLGQARVYGMVARTEQDGWRRNSAGERTLLNAGLITPLGGRTEVRLHAVAADNRFGIPGPLTRAALDADPRQANAVYAERRERRHNRLARGSVHVQHRATERVTVDGMLFAQPKRLIRSERGTYREFDRRHAGGSLGARWEHAARPGLSGSFSTGVDYARQGGPGVFYSLSEDAGKGDEVRTNQRENSSNFGVYAQEQLSAGDLEVVLGARWDAIEYDVEDLLDPRLSDRRSFTRLSPKLGLVWRLSPAHSVYAGVGGGVEAPAGNETDPVGTFGDDTIHGINPLLRPIRSTTYEVGTKAIHAGPVRAFSYDLALYWTEVRDEIVPYRGGRFYFSAGAVRRRGAELGVRVVTAPGVEMDFAVTGNDHRYTRYAVDSVHYGRPGATADFAGNRVVGVPDVHGSAALRWAPPFRRETELEVGMQWVDGFWADDANAVRVPGYALLNAGVGLRRPLRLPRGLSLRGSLRLENLLDERYVASAFLNPDVVNGEPVAFEPGLPRHAVLTFSLGWGR